MQYRSCLVDGSRKRRHSPNLAKRAYYADHRNQRYAAKMLGKEGDNMRK